MRGRSWVSFALGFILVTPFLYAMKDGGSQPKVGDTVSDLSFTDLAGESFTLTSLREKGPVVLIMLRGYPGYQCPLCTKQVGELLSKAKDFTNKDAQVVLIYPGAEKDLTKRANEFLKGRTLPEGIRFATDPDYKITNELGLRWMGANETAYPTSLVIDRQGKIVFAKISKSHGGRSNAKELLAEIPDSN